jgi:FkbH-like protein
MRFSTDEVSTFAAWSGDHNPLHVDAAAARRTAFGHPVVHGMLTTIRALAGRNTVGADPLRRLDVEFRNAITPGADCTIERQPSTTGTVLSVVTGGTSAMTLRINPDGEPSAVDLGWTTTVGASAHRVPSSGQQPADLDIGDFQTTREIIGTYHTAPVPGLYLEGGSLRPLHARVLALCSYVIGMETPGLRSLFTRLQLDFADDIEDRPTLLYRVRTVRLDPHFRLLDLRLEVVTPDGAFVAAGDLRSYVRFMPNAIDPVAVRRQLSSAARQLGGKVALITGGTRGLGAEITTALAMAGCDVYASFHSDRAAADELDRVLRDAGAAVTLLEGDAGDRSWCASALSEILARHGQLDILVLNACAPPSVLRFGPDSADAWNAYIAANLPLAQVPLATCLPALAAAKGTVVGISSSFVADAPAGFGHYVALKQATESMIRTAVREVDGVAAMLARPPRLQTAWNDTPTGVLGTITARDAAIAIVNAVAHGSPTAGAVDLLEDFKPLPPSAPAAAEHEPEAEPEFSLALAASFTAEPLVGGFRFWFRELGVRGEVDVAPYGQILQTLLTPDTVRRGGRGMHVVMLRLRDWLRELRREDADSSEFLRDYLASMALDLERAMRTHRAQAAADTLLVLCPSSPETPDAAELLLEDIEARLLEQLRDLPGLTVIRARDFHAAYDVSDNLVADHVREHLAHIPYQPGYLHTLSTIAMRHVHRRLAPARKVVVVDCDNTLWGGVVGEVGASGIVFDDGHRALHDTLTRLSESGVLIALCSKNEEADVWSVFESRTDFALRRECIVSAAINWQPKSANLRAMADRLNLGLDSFVFIDDNPVECAEVRAACPHVLTLEWPQDADAARRLLLHTWELDPRGSTAEDRRRTELYREEFKRQELQQTLTFRDFIDSLGLAVDIQPLTAEDLKRASQLTLRTNQFNFTTIRRDEAAMQALASAGTHEIRTVRVRDRFGDYGLVGLVIAEPRDGLLFADTFLLSCRVLGRGVEHQMVAELGRIAATAGASRVHLRIEPTPRNTPARNFLRSIAPADAQHDDGGILELELSADAAGAIRFEPPEQAPPAVTEGERKAATAPADERTTRSREQQIARTAWQLSTPEALLRAIDLTTGRTATPPAPVTPADASFVFEAFARALGIDEQQVRSVDSLEHLGCDSFKIVEITVSLLERFPHLPSTLLFEHRTVSDIAKRVAALSTPSEAILTSGAPRVTGRPEGMAVGDIAVVGMHLRCAGAGSTDELWDLLSSGKVAVSSVPEDRKYFLGRLSDTRPHFAGLLDDVDRFEAELFGITPREAELMDPQLRLFLEVAWGALEDAGALGTDLDPDTGVFAGVMYGDYGYRANIVAREAGNPFKCWEGFSLANRLSQVFGFRGPSIAVDTACSSSASAIHLACRALNARDCRVAIAGGVNLILDPDRFVQLGRLGILSASGHCLPFGADADGTVLGEGAGVVVLRPLVEALERGDRIYGVIKATGVSTGSGTVGFTAPNPQAQAIAIQRALSASGVDPRTVSYIETHGTGTALGDPIEVRGLTLAYGNPELQQRDLMAQHLCAIGSIKPNVGHLEAGAGVLGLIKALLQLHRRTLVPSLTSDAANPQIPFSQTPFAVQRVLGTWERPTVEVSGVRTEVPRRAALNSFGVGGANVHVVLEEGPEISSVGDSGPDRPLDILTLTARTADGLQRRATDLAKHLSTTDAPAAEVCFSANTAQRPLARRAAVIGRDRAQLIEGLERLAAGEEPAAGASGIAGQPGVRPRVAFLFTGQGSQYAGMGRDLYETQPDFKAALDRCCDLFRPLLERELKDCLFAADGSADAALLNQTAFTQPALFSLGYALSELWRSWGVVPDVVLGHSIGELTAMCVAGGLSLEDAVTVVAARGRLMQALPAGGAMTSIMATEERVAPALAGYEDRVALAAINGPDQVVISGDASAVAEIAQRFTAEGVRSRSLVVSHAFHSPLMKPILDEYAAVLARVRFSRPSTTFVSSVIAGVADAELVSKDYWLRNVLDTVRFADAVRSADALDVSAYLEMGPQPVLLALSQQCLPDEERLWLPSIRKDGEAWPALTSALARMHATGFDMDWRGFDRPYARRRVSIPSYPFAGRRYWIGAIPTLTSGASSLLDDRAETKAATYEIGWREQPLSVDASRPAEGVWVVLADAGGVGATLARTLESRGAQCVVATAGDSDEPDPSRILARVPGGSLRGVVLARTLDFATAAAEDGGAVDAKVVEQAVGVMQALVGSRQSGARLWLLSRAAVPAGLSPDVRIDPAQAALWGAGRSFGLEHPEHWGGLIDLSPGLDAASAAEAVAGELLVGGDEDQVALRERTRLVPRLQPLTLSPVGSWTPSATGTYLVTGGLGALGLHIADWLVNRGARALVLTGRRGAETPGVGTRIDALRARGASITIVASDVSRREGVSAVIDAVPATAPLAGVFHAAGLDDVKPVAQTRPDDVARVMAAKATGAWWLHERTKELPLDLFVCFSSIAAVLGSPGRTAYAASNALVDALVQERRRLGLRALSVNWGPWAGGGMASADALEQYRRVGNHGLVPADAMQQLERLIATDVAQAMVADIDWSLFKRGLEARRVRPLLADMAEAAPSTSTQSKPGAAPWVEELSACESDQRLDRLVALLRAEIAQTLGLESATDVPVAQRFRDLGMDSLMAADFSQRLQKRLGIRSTAMVFEHPTVTLLAPQLLAKLPLAVPAPVETAAVVMASVSHAAAGAATTGAGAGGFTPPMAPDHGASDIAAAGLTETVGRTEGYSPDVVPDVMAFQRTAWPHRRPDLLEPRWRWMFVDSARRLNVQPQVWLHRQNERIVGHNGAIPVRLKIGSEERPTAWLVDTMVLPEYRDQAVGARLMVEAHEDLPFALSLGQTEQMRAIQLRLGWHQVAPLQTAMALIRPERVLSGKLPKPAALAAGLAFRARSLVREAAGSRSDLQMRFIERFDDRHDELWERTAHEFGCAVRRDASYLNWKYVDQPGLDFLRLEVQSSSGTMGVIVLNFRDPDEVYRYRRAFLVDVVAPLSNQPFVIDLVRTALNAAADRGADALLCLHIGSALTAALQAAGFRLREPSRHLLVRPGDFEGPSHANVLDPAAWFVTHGDSDIDRP